MKNLITILFVLVAVGCSNEMRMVEDANTMLQTELKKSNTENKKLQSAAQRRIKKLTDANTKLQTKNTKIQEELDIINLHGCEKYQRLLAKDRVDTKTLRELAIAENDQQVMISVLSKKLKGLQDKITILERDK